MESVEYDKEKFNTTVRDLLRASEPHSYDFLKWNITKEFEQNTFTDEQFQDYIKNHPNLFRVAKRYVLNGTKNYEHGIFFNDQEIWKDGKLTDEEIFNVIARQALDYLDQNFKEERKKYKLKREKWLESLPVKEKALRGMEVDSSEGLLQEIRQEAEQNEAERQKEREELQLKKDVIELGQISEDEFTEQLNRFLKNVDLGGLETSPRADSVVLNFEYGGKKFSATLNINKVREGTFEKPAYKLHLTVVGEKGTFDAGLLVYGDSLSQNQEEVGRKFFDVVERSLRAEAGIVDTFLSLKPQEPEQPPEVAPTEEGAGDSLYEHIVANQTGKEETVPRMGRIEGYEAPAPVEYGEAEIKAGEPFDASSMRIDKIPRNIPSEEQRAQAQANVDNIIAHAGVQAGTDVVERPKHGRLNYDMPEGEVFEDKFDYGSVEPVNPELINFADFGKRKEKVVRQEDATPEPAEVEQVVPEPAPAPEGVRGKVADKVDGVVDLEDRPDPTVEDAPVDADGGGVAQNASPHAHDVAEPKIRDDDRVTPEIMAQLNSHTSINLLRGSLNGIESRYLIHTTFKEGKFINSTTYLPPTFEIRSSSETDGVPLYSIEAHWDNGLLLVLKDTKGETLESSKESGPILDKLDRLLGNKPLTLEENKEKNSQAFRNAFIEPIAALKENFPKIMVDFKRGETKDDGTRSVDKLLVSLGRRMFIIMPVVTEEDMEIGTYRMISPGGVVTTGAPQTLVDKIKGILKKNEDAPE